MKKCTLNIIKKNKLFDIVPKEVIESLLNNLNLKEPEPNFFPFRLVLRIFFYFTFTLKSVALTYALVYNDINS